MAFYEYRCTRCGNVFTLQQSFDQHDRHEPQQCPQCGAAETEQIYTSVNVITAKKS